MNSSEQLCTSYKSDCQNSSLTCTIFDSYQGGNTWHNDHSLHMQPWDGEEENGRNSIVQQLSKSVVMSQRKMSRTGYTIVGFKWYNSYCIEQTIVNVNIVMHLPSHPFWISSGSEKMCFPLLDKIVLLVCEKYHHNGCRYHKDQLLKEKLCILLQCLVVLQQ